MGALFSSKRKKDERLRQHQEHGDVDFDNPLELFDTEKQGKKSRKEEEQLRALTSATIGHHEKTHGKKSLDTSHTPHPIQEEKRLRALTSGGAQARIIPGNVTNEWGQLVQLDSQWGEVTCSFEQPVRPARSATPRLQRAASPG